MEGILQSALQVVVVVVVVCTPKPLGNQSVYASMTTDTYK